MKRLLPTGGRGVFRRLQGRLSASHAMRKLSLSLTFLLFTYCAMAQLNGVKTIDPAGSGPNNYTSFTAAVNALISSGVNGPVLFQVAAGTYTGQVTIPAISGANATNTITFDGGYGNAATRIVTFAATSTTDAHVIRFNSASYIILKNLTIKNTGTSAGLGISIYGSSNNCQVIRCNVYVDSTSSSTNFKAIQMTNSTSVTDGSLCGASGGNVSYITIDSCEIVGGNFNFYGQSSFSNTGVPYILMMRANRMRLAYQCAIGISNLNGYQINYNFIDMRTTNNGNYGFSHCNGSTSGSQVYEMIGNTFANCGQYGMYVLTRNNNGARGKIWNNFFRGDWRSTSARAIYLGYDRNFDIWGNTIIIQNAVGSSSAGIYLYPSGYPNDVKNNNVVISNPSASGLGLYSESGCLSSSDYNNYYKVNNNPGEFLAVLNGSQVDKSSFKGFGGFETNSYSEDPILLTATDPRPNSACLRGIYQATNTVDINGTVRLNPPTVGAAESQGGFALDVAVDAFTKPVFPIASGNNDIELRIKNKGTNTVTSISVNVQLGSTTRTINWTGSLAACAQTTVLFNGSNQINIAAGKNTLKAWVASPNGGVDQNTSNDTITQSFCTPFAAGTYTIDPSGSGPNNYTSITAVTDIINCGGISGPVTFNLAATTFNERIYLVYVKGASSVNTITFKGAGAGSTILVHPALTNSAVVSIQGTPGVTIDGMTMRLSPNSSIAGVQIASKSDSCIIRNNSIEYTAYTTNTCFGIVFGGISTSSSGNESDGTLIENNTILNSGYAGIFMAGGSSSAKCTRITIRNNTITNPYQYGIYSQYADNLNIQRNRITMGNYMYNIPLYIFFSNNDKINENIVKGGGQMGLYLYGSNCEVINNMITDFTSYDYSRAVQLTVANNVKFWHNTVFYNTQATAVNNYRAVLYLNSTSAADVRNNILVYNGSSTNAVVLYKDAGSSFTQNNSNVYYNGIAPLYTENYSTFYNTLADYQAYQPTLNTNSIVEMPSFLSTSLGSVNGHLASSYDAPSGENLGITVDVDGDPRCVYAPTIGADQSTYPQITPKAEFVASDSIFENSGTRIVNTSKGNPSKYGYQWLVDGIIQSTSRDLDYVFTAAGTYEVKLIVMGCSGNDTIKKTITVVLPTTTPIADFVADKQVVDLYAMVKLRDISKHGPTQWQWSATPSFNAFFTNDLDQNTSVFFGAPGYYDVCLHVENNLGAGKDTCKDSYIYVKEDYSMCGGGTNVTTNSRYGKLSDDGGPSGNYTANRNCTYLIDACASSVTLKFSQFNVGAGDALYIYNGANASAPLLGSFTGTSIPGGSAGITASSGKMFINWKTDASTQTAGFAAEWVATPDATPAPVADFTFPDTLYTDENIVFTSSATGSNIKYDWDVEYPLGQPGYKGGDKSTEEYSYGIAGNYDVKLRVFNCAGSNSIVKTITVIDPTTPPQIDFVADKTLVPVNGLVTFTNKTLKGAYSYRWETSPSLGVTIKPNANSKDITATFLVPGSYSVKLVAKNAAGEDSLTKTSYITVYDYCNPGVASIDGKIGISNVTFGAINNTSASGTTAYTSYTNLPQYATVTIGGTYPISISRTNNTDQMNRKVWIDWNIDGDFDDAGEEVLYETASRTLTYTADITVPLTATEGFTRMRVGVSHSNNANKPCGWNAVGEFEDYTVMVIKDAIAPVITLNGPSSINVERWYQYVEQGVTAIDNIDGNLTSSVVITSNVDSTTEGVYTVKYEVTDQAGNKSTVNRTVVVTPDVTLPVITLNGSSNMKQTVKTPFTDPGATATDYFNRSFTSVIIINSNVDTNKVGNYTITYEVTDLSGNKAVVVRNVQLVDDVAPVITKSGPDPMFVEVKTPFVEPGISATDNYDASVTVMSGTVNVNQTGTYTLTYTATDSAGNIATETRTVIVRDTQKPVIKINGLDTVIVDVFTPYHEEGATATDNYCTGLVVNVTSPTVNINRVGSYTVTYDVTDCEGNVATTATRVVKVVDRIAPVIQLKGVANTTRIMRWMPYVDAGATYTDNYYSVAELTPLLVTTTNVNTAQEGIYEYCYDLTDPSGNVAQRVCRTVEVIANTTGYEELFMSNAVNVYPNPTRGELNVAVDFGQSRPVKITIHNMLGETIATVDNQGVAKNIFTFDLNGFAAGLYMVKIESEGMSTVKKVNLVH